MTFRNQADPTTSFTLEQRKRGTFSLVYCQTSLIWSPILSVPSYILSPSSFTVHSHILLHFSLFLLTFNFYFHLFSFSNSSDALLLLSSLRFSSPSVSIYLITLSCLLSLRQFISSLSLFPLDLHSYCPLLLSPVLFPFSSNLTFHLLSFPLSCLRSSVYSARWTAYVLWITP